MILQLIILLLSTTTNTTTTTTTTTNNNNNDDNNNNNHYYYQACILGEGRCGVLGPLGRPIGGPKSKKREVNKIIVV